MKKIFAALLVGGLFGLGCTPATPSGKSSSKTPPPKMAPSGSHMDEGAKDKKMEEKKADEKKPEDKKSDEKKSDKKDK